MTPVLRPDEFPQVENIVRAPNWATGFICRMASGGRTLEQKANEPRTRLYMAWQQQDDPTRFVHFFIFEDESAHESHGQSAAVKRFESIYGPELVGGPVKFTDFNLVASNSH
jgi:quinol monooxygenase YgiN